MATIQIGRGQNVVAVLSRESIHEITPNFTKNEFAIVREA
jgi:molybdopterin-binding protein